MITEERQSPHTTMFFIAYCRRDPCVLLLWFVVLHVLSLLSCLLGDDMVQRNITEARPP